MPCMTGLRNMHRKMMSVTGYNLADTIVALGTPPGRGALGVVRLSGDAAWAIARCITPGLPVKALARRVFVVQAQLPAPAGAAIESTCVVVLWRAPLSYTGEDMAELSLHGNPALLQLAEAACTAAGARLAEAGEFTYRAYVNGKLDLAQAEAVQELVAADGAQALRLAATALLGASSMLIAAWDARLAALLAEIEVFHDYASDDLDSSLDTSALAQPQMIEKALAGVAAEIVRAIEASHSTAPLREGVTVALCGPPNAGKSTLFNTLLGHQRAITSPQPGTTRDFITATVEVEGLRITFIDTAGMRAGRDAIESAGVELAQQWGRSADIVLWLETAGSAPQLEPGLAGAWRVETHCDQLAQWPQEIPGTYHVSGTTRQGVDALRSAIAQHITAHVTGSALGTFTARHTGLLSQCSERCHHALAALRTGFPLDGVAADLQYARAALQSIGQPPDRDSVLAQVFSRFCVGK
jgi:tRNA modification GTPase